MASAPSGPVEAAHPVFLVLASSWCAGKQHWTAPALPGSAERRRENTDDTKAVSRSRIDQLCWRRDVPLREKTLWRMLYESASRALGGVGGQVAQASVCPAYGGAAVQGTTVYEPCAQGGMAAISTAGNKIRVRWRGPGSAQGSPVVGGGAIWVTDYQAGTLYELGPATGAARASLSLGTSLPHFSSMSMTGNRAYLGTMAGVVAVGGV